MPDPRVQGPQALPGIGPITAMTLVAEIGDISRFPTARKLCAWAGLTPQVRNSDRTVRHGHITKMGSPWVRFVLQEAALGLPRFDGQGWWLGQATCLTTSSSVAVSYSSGVW